MNILVAQFFTKIVLFIIAIFYIWGLGTLIYNELVLPKSLLYKRNKPVYIALTLNSLLFYVLTIALVNVALVA